MNVNSHHKINEDFITITLLQDELQEQKAYIERLEGRLERAYDREDNLLNMALYWMKKSQNKLEINTTNN